MDSMGASGMSAYSDPKTQIMRQVQQESAMQNARMLVEVRILFGSPTRSIPLPKANSRSSLNPPSYDLVLPSSLPIHLKLEMSYKNRY
jgi:hypothetical protein